MKTKMCTLALSVVLALFVSACAERDSEEGHSGAAPQQIADSGDGGRHTAIEPARFALGEALKACNIETVNGISADGSHVAVAAGSVAVIEGWVLPGESASPEDWTVFASREAGHHIEAVSVERIARPDLNHLAGPTVSAVAGFRAHLAIPVEWSGIVGLLLAPQTGAIRMHCAAGRAVRVNPK